MPMPVSTTSMPSMRVPPPGRRLSTTVTPAALGELERVADEVGHDLPHTAGIGEDRLRNRPLAVEAQPQAFVLGPHREDLHHLPDDRVRRARDALHLHAPGLDLGQVEDVVDQVEQVLAAGVDRVQVLHHLRLVLVVAPTQHIGEAQDRVHRCADLVAHVGQEIALGAVGLLGVFLGLAQLDLLFLQLGDVLEADQHALRLACRRPVPPSS